MELEQLKKEVSLLDYAQQNSPGQVEKVGPDKYRLNPCPVCGHKDHFTIYPDTNSYSSFGIGCNCKGGSIIDYLIEVEGMEQAQAISKLKQLAGVEDKPQTGKPAAANVPQLTEIKEALSLIEKAQLSKCEYYYNRGLTDKTINKYRLGYLAEGHEYGKHYKYLIPLDGSAYTVRTDNDQEKNKYKNSRGPAALLNERYLQDPQLTGREIYITEGPIDALSLEELDKPAIALNSTAGKNKLLEAMGANLEQLKEKVFILALDTDEAGQKAAKEIVVKAQALGLSCVNFSLNGYKDINEALINDREGLQKQLEAIPLQGTVYDYLQEQFELDQAQRLNEKEIQTGIKNLDHALGGGLYPGLYVLGAISSLGKTAMALQLADKIAEQEQQVLFFSLEMARYEMVCRSLTRQLYEQVRGNITTGHVLKSSYQGKDLFDDDEFKEALQIYKKGPAKYLSLVEGGFATTIKAVEHRVKEHITRTGSRPVIFIDYLQVIQPEEGSRLSDKQHIDQVVVSLKRLSRDLETPVIAISSFNRANYKAGAAFEAFKESGAIEYTADVVLALQLRGLVVEKDGSSNVNELKTQNPRPLDLVILKNRRGLAFEEIELDYYPKQNYFDEV